MAVFNGCNSRRIIAAIFQAAQGINEIPGDRLLPQNPNNSAHGDPVLLFVLNPLARLVTPTVGLFQLNLCFLVFP